MDAQQEIFTKLLVALRDKGYDVYDGLMPPAGTPYPFIYIADSTEQDNNTKNSIMGNIYQTIHVWHNNPRERGTVSQIMSDIKAISREIKGNGRTYLVNSINQRIIPDNTTSEPLLHGVIDITYLFG